MELGSLEVAAFLAAAVVSTIQLGLIWWRQYTVQRFLRRWLELAELAARTGRPQPDHRVLWIILVVLGGGSAADEVGQQPELPPPPDESG
ncbi:hypothetical protein GCM10022225_25530 [Plantactinospora mayteni]|uniref:Uncharacterized protein n=1 Tax=Plantactinospora mayteni TaxID=566021 RepID=A0ABQ4EIZ4_9ACTN|nr:hypothetical protein Pma05_12900 [Plantactinospora mayteni]